MGSHPPGRCLDKQVLREQPRLSLFPGGGGGGGEGLSKKWKRQGVLPCGRQQNSSPSLAPALTTQFRGDGWGPALTPATAQSAAPCRITPTWPARNRVTRDGVLWSQRGLGPSGQHRRVGGPATSSLTFPRSRPQVRRRRSRSSTCSEVEARRAENPCGLDAPRLYPLSAQTRPPAHQSPSSARDAPASAPGRRGWGLGRRSAPIEMATFSLRLSAGS